MFFSKIPALFKSRLITVAVLLNGLIFLVAYIDNQRFLWLLLITMPLLIFAVYKLNWKINSHLNSYFREQKLNAIHANIERLSHPGSQIKISKNDLRITIGNDDCKQPYRTSVYNIRVKDTFKNGVTQMVITELPANDEDDTFAEDSRTYHFVGGEKILQIGPGYSGCRTESGDFDARKFKQNACQDSIKMIELNLSSAYNQPHDVAYTTGIENLGTLNGRLNLSAMGFTAFSDAEGMTRFIDTLRRLSGSKPVGIRICLGDKKEFYRICHAIVKTRVIPDFIVVEGADKKPDFATTHLGMSLYEALLFVSKSLQVYGLDKNIKIIASADINSGFDVLKILALGANAVCSQMPGYKIIKYLRNDSKEFLMYKSQDVADFHEFIISATARIMEANKFKSIADITIAKLLRRLDVFLVKSQVDKFDYKDPSASAKVFMNEY
ncbi:MAG: glutamate synthase-related protein [Ferruginibacter sp.]